MSKLSVTSKKPTLRYVYGMSRVNTVSLHFSAIWNKSAKQSEFGNDCHFSHPARRVESASIIHKAVGLHVVCLCVCLHKPSQTVSSWYFWLGPSQKLDPLPYVKCVWVSVCLSGYGDYIGGNYRGRDYGGGDYRRGGLQRQGLQRRELQRHRHSRGLHWHYQRIGSDLLVLNTSKKEQIT